MSKCGQTQIAMNIWPFGRCIDLKGVVRGPRSVRNIREVKFDVYGKRQTANCKLLPSVFSSLYSRINIFVFAMNSKRHFSIFV